MKYYMMITSEVEIPRRNGKILHGTLYNIENDNKKNKKLVIICHGFSGDQNEWGRFPKVAARLVDNGYNALTFDFAGSGKNEREEVSILLQVRNLEDVYKWTRKKGFSSIGTIGLSFGGLTALLADLPERKASVFWAPGFYFMKILSFGMRLKIKLLIYFAPWVKVKYDSLNNLPIIIGRRFFVEIQKLDVNKYLSDFKTPALLMQGTEDDVVGPENNYEAFSYFPDDEDHTLIKVKGANHDFNNELLDEFIEKSIKWFKKYL
jgi:pimeloyl-ACP methyl ester carboxylesterase